MLIQICFFWSWKLGANFSTSFTHFYQQRKKQNKTKKTTQESEIKEIYCYWDVYFVCRFLWFNWCDTNLATAIRVVLKFHSWHIRNLSEGNCLESLLQVLQKLHSLWWQLRWMLHNHSLVDLANATFHIWANKGVCEIELIKLNALQKVLPNDDFAFSVLYHVSPA